MLAKINTPRDLANALRRAVRACHYRYRTEQVYLYWVRSFVRFHRRRHPRAVAEPDVGAFLPWLAVGRKVTPSMQNQALNALAFLDHVVLDRPLADLPQVVRAKRRGRLPTVLTLAEVGAVLSHLEGLHWMVVALPYGSGLRLREAPQPRVKDLDFPRRAVVIRHGKGGRDRVVTMPDERVLPPGKDVDVRRIQHRRGLERGVGTAWLPHALERK